MALPVFESFEELSKASYEYLYQQQDVCNEKYLLGVHQRWFYDQDTGLISFSNDGKDCLRFGFESIGSISLISNTWLWSWANNSVLESTMKHIEAVRQYGLQNGYGKLFEEKWEADIYDGWEMTAISAYLLNGLGAYRTPNDEEKIFHFKLLMEVEYIDVKELSRLKRELHS